VAGSNHNFLGIKTEHVKVYKLVIEPKGWDQAQEVIESIPLPSGKTDLVKDKWVFPCTYKNNIIINISSVVIMVLLKINTEKMVSPSWVTFLNAW
jgi:hypothetical protein